MNENTVKLLEQLAQKLGTTSEYLWRVLLNQAAISATTDLIITIIVISFGVVLFNLNKRFMKHPANDKYKNNIYEEYEAAAIMPMILGTMVFAISLIICLFNITNIINGYFNPEYWALKEVLNYIR